MDTLTIVNDFILASASPRRRELLAQLGLEPMIVAADIDESIVGNETPSAYVNRMATSKAEIVFKQHSTKPVLAADTSVIIANQILGKPVDHDDALKMLALLSDNTHQVMTSVCLITPEFSETIRVCTEVTFAKISAAQASQYWHTGEPKDKAGSYAVQGIGAMFVKAVHGSYSAVVGLPIYETAQLLERAGIKIL